MELDEAIVTHTRWKMRLLQGVRGQGELPPVAEVGRDDACALGRWFAGEGAVYASWVAWQQARSAHVDFHRRAAEVVAAALAGNAKGAEALLAPAAGYAEASEAVVFALTKLKTQLARDRADRARRPRSRGR
jgi:chemoreceptor zinc-binding protein